MENKTGNTKTKQFSIKLPIELYNYICEKSKNNFTSKSAIVIQSLLNLMHNDK